MKNVLVKDSKNEILALCKNNVKKNEELKFVELGRNMFKDKPEILKRYFRNEKGEDCYYPNLLWFRTVVGEIDLSDIKEQLKIDFGQKVSLAGYKYNPEHYKFRQQFVQDEYEEDLFREQEDKPEEIKQIDMLDFDAVKALSRLINKAVRKRVVIIFQLEDIPSLLNRALDCYYKGVSCRQVNEAMNAKLASINSLLNNKEVVEWIKTNPTDMSFDKEDYVETYQRVMRTLTDCKESLEEYRDCIHNEEDLFEDDIIENNYIECDSYEENEEYNESEED